MPPGRNVGAAALFLNAYGTADYALRARRVKRLSLGARNREPLWPTEELIMVSNSRPHQEGFISLSANRQPLYVWRGAVLLVTVFRAESVFSAPSAQTVFSHCRPLGRLSCCD